ncbi:MAG: hypothetical protein ACR2MX_06690 [Cyclobacteriaceae bacterium]
MKYNKLSKLILVGLIWTTGCSNEDPDLGIGPIGPAPKSSNICKVQEMEFRNGTDQITSIREFNYNINRKNRLESLTIVEGLDQVPLAFRFEFHYNEEESIIPSSIDEVFGGDIQTSIEFRFSDDGNLSEFIQYQVSTPSVAPESHVFFYEPSALANDSINTRIIVFDIERLTRNWIDIFPAIFTAGGQRITRFEKVNFRGDLLEFCDFSYDDLGFLEKIECRTSFGILSEVWDFSYQQDRLTSAFQQLPNFRAMTDYEYDNKGKPLSVVSTTDGFFNWDARYFYLCN